MAGKKNEDTIYIHTSPKRIKAPKEGGNVERKTKETTTRSKVQRKTKDMTSARKKK